MLPLKPEFKFVSEPDKNLNILLLLGNPEPIIPEYVLT